LIVTVPNTLVNTPARAKCAAMRAHHKVAPVSGELGVQSTVALGHHWVVGDLGIPELAVVMFSMTLITWVIVRFHQEAKRIDG
jgi:hypothetical protein